MISKETIEKLIKLIEELTKDHPKGDDSHGKEHHLRVYAYAILICISLSASERLSDMALISALIHDLIDPKYPNVEEKKKVLIAFLESAYPDLKTSILWIIENMSYSKEVKFGRPTHPDPEVLLARNIVSDADKLDALGIDGIERCQKYTKGAHPELTDKELLDEVKKHCHEKLLRLKDHFIVTPKGKSLAEEKHDYILRFVSF